MSARSTIPKLFRPISTSCNRRAVLSHQRAIGAGAHGSQRLFTSSAFRYIKKYTEDHEWIELSADKKTATLGISKYAAEALGDVTYVELPQVDLEVGTSDAVGGVESVKSASDILSPVPGKVIEINEALQDTPGLISKDPEGEGWVCKLEVPQPEQIDGLMDADAYKKFTEESS